MSQLRIGVIGAGGIAQDRHIPALATLEEATLEAVYDLNEATAQSVQKRFGFTRVCGDVNELLDQVDAVIICTPNKFHANLTVQALDAGVHVFCEKPMAMNAIECEQMIQASKRAGKVLTIGYHYRSTTEAQAAKKLIEANEIGEPLVARAHAMRRRKVPGWGVFTNKELQGGGSLIDWGCHFLDLTLWLLGNPKPVSVSGKTYNTLSKMTDQVNEWGKVDPATFNVDDHVTAYITFENGLSLLFETSWAANVKEDSEGVSISGTTGGIDLFPLEVNQAKHGLLLNSQTNYTPGETDTGVAQLTNFLRACQGKEELVVKPEQAAQVTQIIDAIYRSSEIGKSVEL